MVQFKKYFPLILFCTLIIVALIYSWPFFKSGYFVTDDGEWAIIRASEMVRELKDRQIPPRWSDFLNHGFGYPLFSFVYPFPYYLAAGLKLIGLSYVTGIKFLFVLSVVLSALFMFLFINKLLGHWAAFIASLFYVTAPYRLTDLYIRGSLGESLSLSLFPLIFYLTLKIFEKTSLIGSSVLSVFLAILILTHNVSALLFIPLWMLLVLFLVSFKYKKDRHRLAICYFNIFFLGISLAAYFVIPALIEKKFLYLSRMLLADPKTYFLTLEKLINLNAAKSSDYVFSLGLPQVIALTLSFIFFLKKSVKMLRTDISSFIYLFSLTSLFPLVYLTQNSSYLLWQIPPLNMIDFPYRIMVLIIFLASTLSGYLARNKISLFLGLLLVVYAVVGNFSLISPSGFFRKNDAYYYTNDATTTAKDELTPNWVIEKPKSRYASKVEIIFGRAEINQLLYNSKSISFQLKALSAGSLQINTIYFPGWKFKMNNKEIPIGYNNPRGLITFAFPQGTNQISGRFTETPLRLAADIISLMAIIFIISRLIYVRKG